MEDYRKLAAKLRICHNPDVDCDGCEDEQVEGCIHKNIGLAADAIENLLTENAALRQQDVADKDVGKNEPLTNAQKIRSMSDEELAEFLWNFNLADVSTVKMGEFGPHMFRHRLKEGLQQPAEETDND